MQEKSCPFLKVIDLPFRLLDLLSICLDQLLLIIDMRARVLKVLVILLEALLNDLYSLSIVILTSIELLLSPLEVIDGTVCLLEFFVSVRDHLPQSLHSVLAVHICFALTFT